MKNFIIKYLHFCPKTGRFLGFGKLNGLSRLLFPFIGVAALIWFLIRVIPKPSRATYPCMRVAYPIASAFGVYLLGLATSAFAIGKIREHWKRARYWTMAAFLIVALVAGFFTFQADQPPVYANSFYLDTANVPVGIARGVFPGRVVWSRNPNATNENCTNDAFGKAYYLPGNTNMDVVNDMVTNSILSLTGKSSVREAWDTLFAYFNLKKGKGAIGYRSGEKILIKTNGIGSDVASSTDHSIPTLANYIMARTSPQPVRALLRQLINDYGIPQQNISVGDPQRSIQNEYWDIWHTEFPNVNYIDCLGGQGRVKSAAGTDTTVFYSDRGAVLRSGTWSDMSLGTPITGDKLYTVIEQADYLIYVSALKVHERAGVTTIGKCNFGSHTRTNAMHLHMGLVNPDGFTPGGNKNSRFGYHQYRVLVDMLGHKKLGGNAMLFVVDGLWGGRGANLPPVKFKMAPFNNDWPSSIFMSQDPIALESVCYDILKAEFTSDKHAETYPQMEGVDDHLYQAADSSYWPVGIRYDPEKDGTVLGSLGVHEHWDNATDMKYSRNLGTGTGIELIKAEITSVSNDNQDSRPNGFELYQNYPNPFNPATTIVYIVPERASVNVTIYDIQGRAIKSFMFGAQSAGTQKVVWDGMNSQGNPMSSGVYVYRVRVSSLESGKIFDKSAKMTLLK
jgi:hypothetical protein